MRRLVHLTHLVLSSATLSDEIFGGSFWWKILLFFVCVCNNSKMNFITQPQEQKSWRRQTQCCNTLCGCLCTWPIWCCPMEPCYMRYFAVHFDPKSCYFYVRTIKAYWILFLNHRNRKVVGGQHNVPVQYVNVCAPNPAGVVQWNPFKWDILWFILIQNLVICVPTTLAKRILSPNHMNKKVVGGKSNVLIHYVDVCAPDPFDVVFCNPFK